jgi:hypothetical protein
MAASPWDRSAWFAQLLTRPFHLNVPSCYLFSYAACCQMTPEELDRLDKALIAKGGLPPKELEPEISRRVQDLVPAMQEAFKHYKSDPTTWDAAEFLLPMFCSAHHLARRMD